MNFEYFKVGTPLEFKENKKKIREGINENNKIKII